MPVLSDARRSVLGDAWTGRRDDAPYDILLFGAFLLLTALFGRNFAQVSVPGTPIYVTEIVLAVVTGLALWRLGLGRAWRLMRERLPLIALSIFLLAGAVAAARGLAAEGFDRLVDDVGLAEYAVVVPIAALVVSDRRRFVLMVKTLAYAGAASVVLWTVAYTAAVLFEVRTPRPRGGSAAGLYMTLPVLWIAARWAQGVAIRRAELSFAALAIVAIGTTNQRGNWVAIAAGLAVAAALAPRPRLPRAAVAAIAGVALMVGGTLVVEAAVDAVGGRTPDEIEGNTAPAEGAQSTREIKGTIQGSGTPEGDNSTWRLAIWRYSLERMAEEPWGISLGRPLEFEWRGRYYDFRRPTPNQEFSLAVAGPHNSFVEIGARMGVFGIGALIALLVIGAARGVRLARDEALSAENRGLVAAVFAMLAGAVAIASLNDALKGPYMGVFFWLLLALLLISPSVIRERT
jgi:hypothetical protein